MDPGETVLASVLGAYECKIMGKDSVRAGALFATEHRILFYAKVMGGFEPESFPYGHIASFEAGKTLMGPHLGFIASGNTVTVKWIKGDPAPLVGLVKQHIHAGTQPVVVAATPLPTAEDHADSLRKIKSLLD
jgi:glycine/serine hydroxymethyltransferase